MLTGITRLLKNHTIAYAFAAPSKPTLAKPKPIAPKIVPKPPSPKPKKGEMLLQTAAHRLNIKQESLKKQLLNPRTTFVTEQEVRLLGIINGRQVGLQNNQDRPMMKKSPVVTIMGHVDHGKTTLIDYLRSSDIANGEAGGITQKIGAFHINCHGEKITFIDTPGHEAFTNMRQRGAKVTDLVVLIVAATEGVKQQTKEVIELVTRDEIPFLVAINKIDVQSVDIETVEQELFEAGVNIEPRGGNVPVIHISAKTGQNVSLLSQLILEQTRELQSCEEAMCEGIVLEAYQNSKGLNAMTMIVKQGMLKTGSVIVVGEEFTRVKHMHDDMGRSLSEAHPGDAVQVVGIPTIPVAGDFVYEVADEEKARFITSRRKQLQASELREEQMKNVVKTAKIRVGWRERRKLYDSAGMAEWMNKFNQKEQQITQKIEELKELALKDAKYEELLLQKQEQLKNHRQYVFQYLVNIGVNRDNFNVVLKFADRGIEETIHAQLESIIIRLKEKNGIVVNIMKSDIGEVSVTDVQEAATCQASIFTFGCEVGMQAASQLVGSKMKPKVHKLIHNYLKDFEESALKRKKEAVIKGSERGRASIAQVFKIKGKKAGEEISVPGVRVQSGRIAKAYKLYLFKNGTPVSDSLYIKTIKSFKKEVGEVKKGDQCTITLDVAPTFDFSQGQELVAYEE